MNLLSNLTPKLRLGAALAVCLVGALAASPVAAAPKLRFQVDQRGDVLMIGNTLGQECRTDIVLPKPVVGTVSDCGMIGLNDSAPDTFWRSEDDGTASANVSSVTPVTARSSATLKLPPGAQVTYARLFWGANLGEDQTLSVSTITVDRPGTGGFSQAVVATAGDIVAKDGGAGYVYTASADVTTLLQNHRDGAYRVTGPARISVVNVDVDVQYAAWSIVVFYKLGTDPVRNLALFDGLDKVVFDAKVDVSISGFLVPSGGTVTGKLGVIAYEGDIDKNDFLTFNGQALSDANNPSDNFFNSSRSTLGMPISVVGDLPQLSGTPGSMSGLDMDFIDIASLIKAGDTSAQLTAGSVNDIYFLRALVTSVASTKPVIETTLTYPQGTSTRPGDTVQLTSTSDNVGDDTGIGIVITHQIPKGLTYVPGSVRFVDGPAAGLNGPKTDAVGDDQVDYDPINNTLRIRIGTGANATTGGSLTPTDKPVVVEFLVRIDDSAVGDIPTQSTTSTGSSLKPDLPPIVSPSGNGTAPGAPTVISVPACVKNADCSVTAPVCDHTTTPSHCTSSCGATADCSGTPGSNNACSSTTMTCVQCAPGAVGACSGSGPGTICLPSGACGCMTNADCGGRVCDTATNKCPKPEADLSVTVTHTPDPAQPSSPITYQVNVHNAGPGTAPGPVVVTYTVPTGGTITSVVPGDGWRCMLTDRTVTCTMANPLPPGDATPIKILVTPDPTGTGTGTGGTGTGGTGTGGTGTGGTGTGGTGTNGGLPVGVKISVTVKADGAHDPNSANNTYEETTALSAYRVAGGGFGCALVSGTNGLSLWGAAFMALASLLAMSRLRRRSRATR